MSEVFQWSLACKSGTAAVQRGRKEGVSWKNVENDSGKNHICVERGKSSLQEKSRVKSFRELADEENRQEYKVSGRRNRQPKEYLEQVKCCHDTECNEPMMKKGFTA